MQALLGTRSWKWYSDCTEKRHMSHKHAIVINKADLVTNGKVLRHPRATTAASFRRKVVSGDTIGDATTGRGVSNAFGSQVRIKDAIRRGVKLIFNECHQQLQAPGGGPCDVSRTTTATVEETVTTSDGKKCRVDVMLQNPQMAIEICHTHATETSID